MVWLLMNFDMTYSPVLWDEGERLLLTPNARFRPEAGQSFSFFSCSLPRSGLRVRPDLSRR
jgi:hypothetical protein